jgi:hypothetical protein
MDSLALVREKLLPVGNLRTEQGKDSPVDWAT